MPTWVVAEIAELKQAASGHVYIELVEKSSSDSITAKAQAVVWHHKGTELRQKFGSDLSQLLKKGNKVLLKVQLDYHAVYGLKLIVNDLDASVTMGEVELRRQRTIERLQKEELIDLNAQLDLPTVLQRVAVISSPTAAGYGDFINHLQNNSYGYAIQYTLFQSAMQGDAVQGEMMAQLKAIAHHAQYFDAVVIIRGGGSKLDLEAFNDYQLAAAVAQMPLPVISGIGHQQDESVIDLVAHTALKTPTAVAEFIVQSLQQFEAEVMWCAEQLKQNIQYLLQEQQYTLRELHTAVQSTAKQKLQQQNDILRADTASLRRITSYSLDRQTTLLDHLQQTFSLFDIRHLLRRGFAIVRKNGKVVKQVSDISPQDQLHISLADGEIVVQFLH